MQILPGANINLAGGISLEGALRGQRGVHELVNAFFFVATLIVQQVAG